MSTELLDFRDYGLSNSCQLLRLLLQGFWDNFGGNKHWGGGFSRNLKLRLLRHCASIRLYAPMQRARQVRREEFDKIKDRRHKLRTMKRCFVCIEAAAGVRHHIFLLHHGGDNRKRNLVSLCNDCHADIHPWLKKEVRVDPDKQSHRSHGKVRGHGGGSQENGLPPRTGLPRGRDQAEGVPRGSGKSPQAARRRAARGFAEAANQHLDSIAREEF